MLQVARLAPKLLGESTELVGRFLQQRQNPDGGFQDRSGRSDLYYTVFGLEGLMALQIVPAVDSTRAHLASFGGGEELDFVHLCCLIRGWATLQAMGARPTSTDERATMLNRLRTFRSVDSGFHPKPGSKHGTVYANFLAVAAYQDLGTELEDKTRLIESMTALRTPDGAWANEVPVRVGATNSTAAAVTLLRNLGAPVPTGTGDWLMARIHPQGGFTALPGAPIPDLLSTATALHALHGLEWNLSGIRESCLDFIDTLWTNEGAFHGHWDDSHLDVEYLYYALLALGHLSL